MQYANKAHLFFENTSLVRLPMHNSYSSGKKKISTSLQSAKRNALAVLNTLWPIKLGFSGILKGESTKRLCMVAWLNICMYIHSCWTCSCYAYFVALGSVKLLLCGLRWLGFFSPPVATPGMTAEFVSATRHSRNNENLVCVFPWLRFFSLPLQRTGMFAINLNTSFESALILSRFVYLVVRPIFVMSLTMRICASTFWPLPND